MTPTLIGYVCVSLFMFGCGIFGLIERRNLIGILISIELMLNAASLNFMAFNRFVGTHSAVGQLMTLFVIGLAAAEATLFLAIVLAVHRHYRSINVEHVDHLHG